jgi:hypothetical protein
MVWILIKKKTARLNARRAVFATVRSISGILHQVRGCIDFTLRNWKESPGHWDALSKRFARANHVRPSVAFESQLQSSLAGDCRKDAGQGAATILFGLASVRLTPPSARLTLPAEAV